MAMTFRRGLRDGIPICLGYLSVSFTFGMMATNGGLPVWFSVVISMTNLTSAGQFAGTAIIIAAGSLIELAVTTFIINIRYMLMSLSLSQKVDPKMSLAARFAIAFGITDEIFAVSMQQKERINTKYFTGLILTPISAGHWEPFWAPAPHSFFRNLQEAPWESLYTACFWRSSSPRQENPKPYFSQLPSPPDLAVYFVMCRLSISFQPDG